MRPDVSRETLLDLEAFVASVEKWNRAINLVSKSTLSEIWTRHIEDSLQLWPLLDSSPHLADLGTGGGLPGLVLAIMNKHEKKFEKVSFVESDARKATFLQAVVQSLDLKVDVYRDRIEACKPLEATQITARALADLSMLLGFAEQHGKERARCLFPKGERAAQEIEAARQNWRFTLTKHPSKTNQSATILEIGEISRV